MDTKILHYCWFGKSKKPRIVKRCIKSWKRYCKDFQIIEWNESNFDVNICEYVKDAYLNKKWAYVSDFCRYYVLFNYGGVYLDTDVEILRNIIDLPNSFVGFEKKDLVASGLIRGASKNDFVCKAMIESYFRDTYSADGNNITVCKRETDFLVKNGLLLNGEKQIVNGLHVFPVDFFCPFNFVTKELKITENTYSIHHYLSSWMPKSKRFKEKIKQITGDKIYNFVKKVKGRICRKK